MLTQFSRTELLLGEASTEILSKKRVAVFGIGGVGSYAVEALARSGIGALDLIDNDKYTLTNLNRQLYATHKSLEQYKVDIAKERISDINPNCKIVTYKTFFLPENKNDFPFEKYDYIIDAIDTVAGKIALIEAAKEKNIPIISAMGAGNKIHPEMFEVADIYKTSVCPLAQVMRKELKKRGIKDVKVVYSKEQPLKPLKNSEEQTSKRALAGSTSFVPPVVGLIMAGVVVRDLLKISD